MKYTVKHYSDRIVFARLCCWSLWYTRLTNEHGYVQFVVITIRSFIHPWLITAFVTRVTRRVSLMEQELLTHQNIYINY